MSSLDTIYRPFESEKLNLKNRIAMAPMTRLKSPNGIPTEDVAAYYERRAKNDVGLVITEGTNPNHPAADMSPDIPAFHGAALDKWEEIVKRVHAAGGKIAPQLWHVGIIRKKGMGRHPEAESSSPSGLSNSGKQVIEPLTLKGVDEILQAFATAAADAKRIGMDAIELHGAHGYLIDQFFWDKSNVRDDQYGGNQVERTRFAADLVQACRDAVGPDYPILLRYSQWKQQDFAARLAPTPQELDAFLAPLTDAGVDIFHCSTRRFWEPEFEDSDMNLAGWTKKLTGKPTMSVGSVGLDGEFIASMAGASAAVSADLSKLVAMMERDDFDLIAVGRALLVDPEWVVKVREGRFNDLIAYTKEAEEVLY